MASCSVGTDSAAVRRNSAGGHGADSDTQAVLSELFVRMGRTMLQHQVEESPKRTEEEQVDAHAVHAAMHAYFAKAVERQARAAQLAISQSELRSCLMFARDQLHSATTVSTSPTTTTVQRATSAAAEFSLRAPIVSLQLVRTHLRSSGAGIRGGDHSALLCSLAEVVDLCRVLDQRLGLVPPASPGFVQVIHLCASAASLVPQRQLRDLIVLVAEYLSEAKDELSRYLCASIYHSWALLDSRNATALKVLSTMLTEDWGPSSTDSLLGVVTAALEKDERLRMLAQCAPDSVLAAEHVSSAFSSGPLPDTALKHDGSQTAASALMNETGACADCDGSHGKDVTEDSSTDTDIVIEDTIDRDFWLRLSS